MEYRNLNYSASQSHSAGRCAQTDTFVFGTGLAEITPVIPRPGNEPPAGDERCIVITRRNWNETIANFICRRRRVIARLTRRKRERPVACFSARALARPPHFDIVTRRGFRRTGSRLLNIPVARTLTAKRFHFGPRSARVPLVRQRRGHVAIKRSTCSDITYYGGQANREMTHVRFESDCPRRELLARLNVHNARRDLISLA